MAELAKRAAVWQEPVRGGYGDPGLLALSGRERLESWRRGHFVPPPLYHLTGARPTNFGDGTADAEMPASGWLLNSAGLIGGGTLAILADIAFGCSIETKLPPATPYTTAEISLSFLRPARPDGMLTAHGQAIHVGRSVALSEAFVLDDAGESLIAHGTSRCAVLDPVEAPPPPPADAPPGELPSYETPDPFERPPPDGVLSQEVWEELGGGEILARQLAGDLPPPPIHHLTGIAPTSFGGGWAEVRMPSSEWLASPLRLLQGGTVAMLADTAIMIAVQSTVPAGTAAAGLDLKINYLRPAPPDGRELTARGEVVHAGRTIAIARCEVTNADGKEVALATGSSMYLHGRPARLGEIELGTGSRVEPEAD
jgi:uncharacterized protein (TIGR00369 family)